MIGGLFQEHAVMMMLAPFKYTHLECASKREEYKGCSYHVISMYTYINRFSNNIYFSDKA